MLIDHLPRLRAYAMSLTRHAADADDLIQAAAERMLKFESHFEVGTNFSAWSYRVLKNSHITNCRKNKHRPISLSPFIDDAAPDAALVSRASQEDQIFVQEVLGGLDKLSPALREILTLVCGAQLSYEEVAVVLSCSVGTVKSRLWRARAQMKGLLIGDVSEQTDESDSRDSAKNTWIGADTVAS